MVIERLGTLNLAGSAPRWESQNAMSLSLQQRPVCTENEPGVSWRNPLFVLLRPGVAEPRTAQKYPMQ